MAIKRASKELVERGAHRVKVSTVGRSPRQYQAACRDCEFKGATIGGGAKADKEALAHAAESLQAKESEAEAELEPEAAAS